MILTDCRIIRTGAVVFSLALFSANANAQISFTDVTAQSNIDYVGESYGASWGYANDDLLPDLFVSHHREDAGLYMNLGDGTFENRWFEVDVWQSITRADHHGGAWGDYDNNGFSDLFVTAGAAYNSQLLGNNGFFLSDQVPYLTFDVRNWGGRMPAWFDFTGDGLLDLLVGASGGQAKFQTHEQVNGDFEKRNFHTGQQCLNNNYGQLSDLNNDGNLEWICSRHDFHPDKIYDIASGLPWIDRTNLMPATTSVVDSQFADFNGDLRSDMIAIRGRARISGTEQTGSRTIETHLINFNGAAIGMTFQTSGDVSFELHTRERNAAHVFIGAGAKTAPYPGPMTPITFTLSPDDPTNHGIVTDYSSVGSDIGVFIGYNPGTQTWTFLDWSDSSSVLSYTYAYVSSSSNISNLTQQNLQGLDKPKSPMFLRQTGSGFVDATAAANLDDPISCVSIATADFDNDMDLDLYVACRNAVSNAANMVLENDGNGVFSVVPNAGGAAGAQGFGVGLSDSVVVSDYDVDGFVDVFVTNGLKLYPELIGYTAGGRDQVFKNNGNANNWIQFDLVGVQDNRDAIGAVVTVTAGGVAQRREANGGYHRWSQDDTRLHFGLAGNTTADVEVRWPNGTVQNHYNVAADGLYEIVQGGAITQQTDLSPFTPDCQDTVGAPTYDVAVDREMFVWRDACGSNNWKVRVGGGPGPQITYTGEVQTDQPLVSVTPVGLEFPWDVLDNTTNPAVIEYSMTVGDARRDGFDFTVQLGTTGCFGVDSNISVAYTGSNRVPITLPFDLETGGPCAGGGGGGLLPSLSIADASVDEDNGTLDFTVSLSGTATGSVDFTASTADGTATLADADYTPLVAAPGSIPEGQLTTTVSVPIGMDGVFESDEAFTVNIALSTANANLADGSATGTINNDDAPLPTLSIADAAADEDSGMLSFTVSLSGVATGDVNFTASTADGTATVADSDYTPLVGAPGTILSGQLSTTVNVPLGTDATYEPDEDLTVNLALLSANANPGTMSATGTIQNDDPIPPVLSVDSVTVEENGSAAAVFTVSLNVPVQTADVRVDIATQDGTATAPSDYKSKSKTLVFFGNMTSASFTVPIYDDSAEEGAEEFYVQLSNPQFAAIAVGQGTARINDDESQGQPVQLGSWTGATGGVSINGNQINYSGSPTDWDNNTVNSVRLSNVGFTTDYEVSWTIDSNPSGTNWVVGLGVNDSGPGRTDVDYGFRSASGSLQIRENGAWRSNGSALSQGHVLKMAVKSTGVIEWYQNGNLLYTSTFNGSPDFYVDTSFKNGAISLSVEVAGLDAGPPPGPFTAITDWVGQAGGVSQNSNSISYSGSPTGWTNTINSVDLSQSGITDNYIVSWRVVNDAGGNWIVGLSADETDAGWRDIEFGWRTVNGALRIYENGNYRQGNGAVSPGDVLGIRVDGNTLSYLLNGVVVRSRSISGNDSYYIDTSFKNGAVSLADFEIVAQ